MNRIIFISLLFIQVNSSSLAFGDENKFSRQDYIDRWKVTALKNMFEHNIPASITLSQGILESGNGNSMLTQKANNHFGIKCHGWAGKGYYMDDDKKDECFRLYDRAEDSFEDHSQFLLKKRYEGLFKLKQTDYKGWAKGLKKAGYATNPEYAKRLIMIIEDNKLFKYDKYTYSEYLDLKNKSEYKSDKKGKLAKSSPKKGTNFSDTDDQDLEFIKGRKIHEHANKIQYIIANEGDDYKKIAEEMNLGRWQILKYNDLEKNDKITKGEVVFIQPKHGKSKTKIHTAQSGDSYWSISQKYGIKLKRLLKMNNVEADQKIKKGSKIKLR